MKKIPPHPFLYVITDCKVHTHFEVAKGALEGGAKVIQYREKVKKSRDMYFEAKNIKELCDCYDAIFIVNDRVDIALSVDADGVHVGQEDLPLDVVREIFPGIVGVSVKNVEQAKKAENADYLGAGAVFHTKTKESKVIGLEGLKKIVESVSIPVVGIGGINAENVVDVVKIGASPAVVSAVAHAEDVKKATEKIVSLINSVCRKKY